jgi:DNA-directed RNA polymerase
MMQDGCDERVEWVNKQRQEIQKVFDDPHTNTWWTEADEPWQFLAFCFEWGGLLKAGGQGYKTYLPCQMDASNNGIQILSMLARDSVGALATNVLPTETPADLYQDVADVVRKKLEEDGSPLARAWLDFGIDRKTCKRPVMVKPYGGTRYSSCRAYIDEWYNDKIIKENVPDPFSGERFAACQFLSTKVWDAMNEILDKPDEVMKWLQKNVRALNVEGKHAEWTSPSGLRVKQHYRGGTRHAVKTVLTEAVVAISYNEDAPTLDKTRQANGISPNFVHSIDAAAVHLTANKCKEFGIHSLSMVHDSFGTHSPSCQRLGDILRYVFVKIFEKDLLTEFQNSLKSLSNTLPSEFKLGDLQVEEVLESKYFFS